MTSRRFAKIPDQKAATLLQFRQFVTFDLRFPKYTVWTKCRNFNKITEKRPELPLKFHQVGGQPIEWNWTTFPVIYSGNNCIQNVHLGSYIVGCMVGNFVLRRRDHITDDIPPQMKILNMVIPNLMHFLTFIRQKHRILHQTEASSTTQKNYVNQS